MINLTTHKLRVLNGETAIKILKIKPQTGTVFAMFMEKSLFLLQNTPANQ